MSLPSPLTLNGDWLVATATGETFNARQPGIIGDPTVPSGTLRLRKDVVLPAGDWLGATLLLKGAKYRPLMRIDGKKLAQSEGGCAPIRFLLDDPSIRPEAKVALEIELASMPDVPADDASMMPGADRWRSNVSSGLWDDIAIIFDRGARFRWVRPRTRLTERLLELRVACAANRSSPTRIRARLRDDRSLLAEYSAPVDRGETILEVPLPPGVRAWSPDNPRCYRLEVELLDSDGNVLAVDERSYGAREFSVEQKSFRLNGAPFQARGGSIGWHRFCRDAEGRTFAFDREWFEHEIIARYKAHGANWFRPHLGLPPEWVLDLCDRHGLCVQVEWPPFHGLPCSRESLITQLTAWIDHAERHPSCVLFHPWNETYDQDELDKGAAVIDTIAKTFPHLVWAHRDVLHAHRYWWSLFENLKLPFDSPEVFAQPIVVDEFGGNYLDGDGNAGGYPELPSAFLRFLGPGHTVEQRLQLQCDASARIAEYWRRLGAAGVSQFCSLSSWEDGNHHFLGALKERRPKPVWQAMTAAWAPVSVSLDLWDRNFQCGDTTTFSVWFFNDTAAARTLRAELRLVVAEGSSVVRVPLSSRLPSWSRESQSVVVPLPDSPGPLTVQLELLEAPHVRNRVISSWKIWLHRQVIATDLRDLLAVAPAAPELIRYCEKIGAPPIEDGRLVLAGHSFWKGLAGNEPTHRARLEAWLQAGKDVILLDAGPAGYGMEAVEDQPRQISSAEQRVPIVLGLTAVFRELAEGDSCFHATPEGGTLWHDLAPENTCLWNGMRGGTVLSCWDMQFEGLHREAFLQQWRERGADPAAIEAGRCFAYELAGFYAFAPDRNRATEDELRRRVEFLYADAPALHSRINPRAPILCTDLHEEWRKCGGQARRISALACAGKNLRRTPVVRVEFGPGFGRLIISQLITAGRLVPGFSHPDYPEPNAHYAIRPDPAARIFLLNLLRLAGAR